MSELRDSSEGTRSERASPHFHDAKRSILRAGRAPSALCAERLSKAQYVTRTRARESMSTPVSKTKSSHISVGFLFYNYAGTRLEKRNRKMRERAYSSAGTRSERTASIFLLRKGATARKPTVAPQSGTDKEKRGSRRVDAGIQRKNNELLFRVRPRCRPRLAVT